MWAVLGEILPLAVGILISPLPIVAAILMLLAPRARSTSVGFLIGWLVGIAIAVTVFTLLAGILSPADPDAATPVLGVVKILLGVLLIVLAISQWRKRPHPGAEPVLPKWMSAIDTMTVGRGLLVGLALSALNPKNLLLGAGAGLAIGAAALPLTENVVIIVVFVLIAAASVAVPVIGYLVAANRMRGPLNSLRTWLVANNATIMSVLLLIIGVVQVGKGIGSF